MYSPAPAAGAVGRRTRVAIVGETGVGKTTSLLTWPARRVVISAPGEQGYDALPADDPNTLSLVWGTDKVEVVPNSVQIVDEVRRVIVAVLQGKHGPVTTVAFDGFHQFYEYALDACSGGAYFAGSPIETARQDTKDDVLDPRAFGQARRLAFDMLSLLLQSEVPYVVVTMWDADKATRKAAPGEHWSKVPTQKLPALASGAARDVLGKFTVVVHASRGRLAPTDPRATWRWQTRASSGILAACIKAPKEVVEKIPVYVPQDWPTLARYLDIAQPAEPMTKEST